MTILMAVSTTVRYIPLSRSPQTQNVCVCSSPRCKTTGAMVVLKIQRSSSLPARHGKLRLKALSKANFAPLPLLFPKNLILIFFGSLEVPSYYIIAGIPSAQAQVCANWVALRKSVVLLATLIILEIIFYCFSLYRGLALGLETSRSRRASTTEGAYTKVCD